MVTQMKIRMLRSLLLLSLALILVIGGATKATFKAGYSLPTAAAMVTNSLAFEITEAPLSSARGEKHGREGPG